MHDTGRGMREESALPSYDAEACGEVPIHICIACRACYTETMTHGLKGAGASAYICTRLSLHVCGTRGVHRSVRRGSWLSDSISVACRAAPGTALSCVAEKGAWHASGHAMG